MTGTFKRAIYTTGKVEYVPIVRLFVQNKDGSVEDIREEFALEQLLGVVPAVGDIIVSPWHQSEKIPQVHDWQNPEDRTFFEVVERRFCPPHPPLTRTGDERVQIVEVYAVLIVKARKGRPDESGLFNN